MPHIHTVPFFVAPVDWGNYTGGNNGPFQSILNVNARFPDSAYLTPTTIFVSYRNTEQSNYPYGAVLSVSGTTVTAPNGETRIDTTTGGTMSDSRYGCVGLDSTRALVFFARTNGTMFGKVASISGTTVTGTGTRLSIDTSGASSPAVGELLDTDKVIIAYPRFPISNFRTVFKVLSVSGTTISAGTETVITDYPSQQQRIAITVLSPTSAVVTFIDQNADFRAIALSISGTTVTVGTAIVVEASGFPTGKHVGVVALDSTRALMTYVNDSEQARAVVLSVSGTTVTAGTPNTFATSVNHDAGDFQTSNTLVDTDKVLIIYRDNLSLIASISGTTVSSFTSPVAVSMGSGYSAVDLGNNTIAAIGGGFSDSAIGATIINP